MKPLVAVMLAAVSITGLAADVLVLDPRGKPVPNAAVVCLGSQNGVGSAGNDGVAHIRDGCRRVHCEIADYVSAQAVITNGKAECHLTDGVSIEANPTPEACRGRYGCSAFLRSFDGKVGESDSLRLDQPQFPGFPARDHFRLKLVPPGRYAFGVTTVIDDSEWVCQADLGTLGAGEVPVTIQWRDPARLTVRAPRPGLTVVVARRLDANEPAGTWRCSRFDGGPPAVTDTNGEAQVLVDPGRPFVIELRVPGNDEPIGRREFEKMPEGVVLF